MSYEFFALIILVILVIISGISITALVFQCKTILVIKNMLLGIKKLYTDMPKAQLIETLSRLSESLTLQLNMTTQVVKQVPEDLEKRVSVEIQNGINPLINHVKELTDHLDQSHSQFQGALMYLAEPGNLQDIGAQFGRAADTLQSMTEIIISNDNMLTEMYKNAGNVLTKWAEQRYLVEESYEKISSVLIRWTEQEQVHREQIEHRLFDRLSELEKTEKNFEKGFNDLKTINESLHNSIQEVQHVVDKIAKNVSETTEIQQEVSQSQKNTAHELQTISKDVRENYSKYTEVLNHLKTMFADLLNNEKQTLKALEVQQKKIIEGMEAMGRQILNNMKTSQLAYDQFWKEYKALLPVGATSEEQAKQTKILIALVVVQSVAMVITAAAIFLR